MVKMAGRDGGRGRHTGYAQGINVKGRGRGREGGREGERIRIYLKGL
jgi:hypothetical protein